MVNALSQRLGPGEGNVWKRRGKRNCARELAWWLMPWCRGEVMSVRPAGCRRNDKERCSLRDNGANLEKHINCLNIKEETKG